MGLSEATLRADLDVHAAAHAPVRKWLAKAGYPAPRSAAVGYAALLRTLVGQQLSVSAARTHRIALAGADYRGPGVNDLCADADVIVEEVKSWT